MKPGTLHLSRSKAHENKQAKEKRRQALICHLPVNVIVVLKAQSQNAPRKLECAIVSKLLVVGCSFQVRPPLADASGSRWNSGGSLRASASQSRRAIREGLRLLTPVQ